MQIKRATCTTFIFSLCQFCCKVINYWLHSVYIARETCKGSSINDVIWLSTISSIRHTFITLTLAQSSQNPWPPPASKTWNHLWTILILLTLGGKGMEINCRKIDFAVLKCFLRGILKLIYFLSFFCLYSQKIDKMMRLILNKYK